MKHLLLFFLVASFSAYAQERSSDSSASIEVDTSGITVAVPAGSMGLGMYGSSPSGNMLSTSGLSNPFSTPDSTPYGVSYNPTPNLVDTVNLAYGALSDVEKGLRPESDCHPSHHRVDRSVRHATLQSISGQPFPVDIISFDYAKQLFDVFARQERIPFRYPNDGCYARAHAMTRMLERRGITAGKAFIEGELRVETPNDPSGFVEWGYHVAPTILIERDGVVHQYIMDPSMFTEPVPIERWEHEQVKHPGAFVSRLYNTPQYQYVPLYPGEPVRTSYASEDIRDMDQTMRNYRAIVRARDEAARRSNQ